MRSEMQKILANYRNYVREDITLEPTSVEFSKINHAQATDQLLALFEKMCNEVIGKNEQTRLEIIIDKINPFEPNTLRSVRNQLRNDQRQALKSKLGVNNEHTRRSQ